MTTGEEFARDMTGEEFGDSFLFLLSPSAITTSFTPPAWALEGETELFEEGAAAEEGEAEEGDDETFIDSMPSRRFVLEAPVTNEEEMPYDDATDFVLGLVVVVAACGWALLATSLTRSSKYVALSTTNEDDVETRERRG